MVSNDAQRLPVQISLELPVVGDVDYELERVEKW